MICTKCNKNFAKRGTYDIHIQNIINPCDHKCYGCGFIASNRSAFRRHKVNCDEYKRFKMMMNEDNEDNENNEDNEDNESDNNTIPDVEDCNNIDNEGCVYFIFETKQIVIGQTIDEKGCKIGSSHNVTQRIRTLQTGNWNELVVYKILKTKYYREWERFFHGIFKNHRQRGEWYKLNTIQVDKIITKYENFIKIHPNIQ